MNTEKLIFLLFILSVELISCKHPCDDAYSTLRFIGFPTNETDTIIARRFQKSSNFFSLIDSLVLNKTVASYYLRNDTLDITIDNGFSSHYDYELYLTGINKNYRITDIYEEIRSLKGIPISAIRCSNFIRSYKINGKNIKREPLYYSFDITK